MFCKQTPVAQEKPGIFSRPRQQVTDHTADAKFTAFKSFQGVHEPLTVNCEEVKLRLQDKCTFPLQYVK